MNHLFAQAEQQRHKRKTLEEIQKSDNKIVQQHEESAAQSDDLAKSDQNSCEKTLTEEKLIIEELKKIARSCQSKHSKPSMSMIRANLEELAMKLKSASNDISNNLGN